MKCQVQFLVNKNVKTIKNYTCHLMAHYNDWIKFISSHLVLFSLFLYFFNPIMN